MEYAPDDVIELKEYWYVFRRNLYGILGLTFVLSAIAIAVIMSMPLVYQSTATLLVEPPESKINALDSVSATGGIKSIYFATQFEILKSKELAEVAIARNRKIFREQYREQTAGGKSVESPVIFPRGFFGKLTVTPIKGTQLAKISYESSNPQFAAAVANELGNVYMENNLEARVQMAQRASLWLAEKSESLKTKLVESEQQLQAYRESEDLVEGVSRTGRTLLTTDLELMTGRLAEAKQRRVQAENIAAQISKLPDRKPETLATLPAVLQNSLVQHLKEQEAAAEQELAELLKRYGEKHPKIIAAQSDLDATRQSVAEQVLKVVEGINKEAEIARATEKDLERQVVDSKRKVQAIKRKEYRLDQLERELATNRQLYDSFLARLKEASDGGEMLVSNARLVDRALPPKRPIKPQRAMLSIAAVLISFLISIFIAFVREATNSTIRSKEDVLLRLHLQLLGVLPLLSRSKEAAVLSTEFANNIASPFAESIRTIRTSVALSALDNPHKILMVTSSVPGEGKTTVAENLAAAFGKMEKTLLIDSDMRRPSVAKNFGINTASPGLSDLVAETATLGECIHHNEAAGFAIIAAGVLPPNPQELLSSKRFASVLTELGKRYDRIIIDTAPCEVVSDALVLSTLVNAVIYVVKAEDTNIKVVKSGISRLRQVNAPITGVVLNQVDVNKHGAHGHHYGGYYDYYGYSGASSEK